MCGFKLAPHDALEIVGVARPVRPHHEDLLTLEERSWVAAMFSTQGIVHSAWRKKFN